MSWHPTLTFLERLNMALVGNYSISEGTAVYDPDSHEYVGKLTHVEICLYQLMMQEKQEELSIMNSLDWAPHQMTVTEHGETLAEAKRHADNAEVAERLLSIALRDRLGLNFEEHALVIVGDHEIAVNIEDQQALTFVEAP